MADPATQFQQAGLNVPYSFTPSMYHPGNVNVPEGAGALWAGVGKNALNAAAQVTDAIRNSTLNPAFRAKMDAQIKGYHLASATLDYALKHPEYGRKITQVAGGEATELAPAQVPVTQQTNLDLDTGDGSGSGKGGGKPTAPTVTEDSDSPYNGVRTGKDTQGNHYFFNTGTNTWDPWPGAGKASNKPPTDPNAAMRQPNTAQVSYPGNSYAASGLPQPFQSAQGGGLIGYPAGNLFAARPVIQPPPAPFYAQGGGEVPTQPTPETTPEATPGTEPGSLSDQYARDYAAGHAQGQEARRQQDLAQWQAKTQTEPITADDAMSWIRRKTTLAKDATYMPNGGPNGEPAYAFHMRTPGGKGTGVNVVPISQMIKDGAAPTAASQNTSAMLSQSDKLQQQQQNALVAPPAPTDQGQTPAPTDQTGQPTQPQGGQVWNPQQPTPGPTAGSPPGPPPAPGAHPGTPQAYDPRQYQVGTLGQNPPGTLMAEAGQEAGTRTDVTPTQQPLPPIRTYEPREIQTSDADKTALNAETDNRKWQIDPVSNKQYKVVSSEPGKPFLSQVYFRGAPTVIGNYGSPLDLKKQQVLDEFGYGGGTPSDRQLSYDEVKGWDEPTVDDWLAQAKYYRVHPLGVGPGTEDSNQLRYASNTVKSLETIKDQLIYARDHKMNPVLWTPDEIVRSKEAGWRDGISPGAQRDFWDFLAKGAAENPFADYMAQNFKTLNDNIGKIKGGRYEGTTNPNPQEWGLNLSGLFGLPQGIDFSTPRGTDLSTIPELRMVGQGLVGQGGAFGRPGVPQSPEDRAKTIQNQIDNVEKVRQNAIGEYHGVAKKVNDSGARLPTEDAVNLTQLTRDGYIHDPGNQMRDNTDNKHLLVNKYGPPPEVDDQGKIKGQPIDWLSYWKSILPGRGNTDPNAPSATLPWFASASQPVAKLSPTATQTPTQGASPSPTPFKISSWKTGEDELKAQGYKRGDGKPFTGPNGEIKYY